MSTLAPGSTRTVIVNGLSVDVEDYFQVQAFAGCIDRARWDTIPCRVEANMDRMLGLFATAGVKGTFFTLGWIADRYPAVIRRIVAEGHELASHGYGHALVHDLTPAQFHDDLVRAKTVLEAVGGVAIQGYRAPTFSIGPRNPWAYDVLEQTGHRYSSSVYPVKHDLYGVPDAPRFPHRPGPGAIVEIPMTTLRLGGRNLPISGGGYFRLMPYALFRTLLRRFHANDNRPGVFYVHPWEIDPGQPRVAGASRLSRFRHTVNLAATSGRIAHLLRDFRWDRIDRVFASDLAALAHPAIARTAA
jgi:polysaccharide deacetylase family protein (PEP-CTERM system associated)